MVDVSPTPASPATPTTPLSGFPWGKLWAFVGALLVYAASAVTGHVQANWKKEDAVKEAAKNTKEEIHTVTPRTNATVEEVTQMKVEMAKLAVEVQRLRERDVARRKKAGGPADTGKVKVAQDEAQKTLHAIKVRNATPNPALTPVPDTATKAPPTTASPQDAKSP